jgi:hypothetical protein
VYWQDSLADSVMAWSFSELGQNCGVFFMDGSHLSMQIREFASTQEFPIGTLKYLPDDHETHWGVRLFAYKSLSESACTFEASILNDSMLALSRSRIENGQTHQPGLINHCARSIQSDPGLAD